MSLIRHIYVTVVESGVARAKSHEDKAKKKFLNQGLFWGVLMFIPDLVFEAVIGFLPATILNLVFIVLATISYLINRYARYTIARNVLFIGLDSLLLVACFIEGTQTGKYLIYISLIHIFSIVTKLDEKKEQLLFLLIYKMLCAIAVIVLCPVTGYIPGLEATDAALMFKGSLFVAMGLAIILSFITYYLNRQRETQLMAAKEQAEQSAKTKLQFISNMSHELRTPLNGIIGTTNLLRMGAHSPQQKEQYELLNYSSQHMLHLVNDVLDFSKIESGKVELENRNFKLYDFVQNIYASFAPQFEQKRLYFKLKHNDDDLNYTICSDDIRLAQVLNNLLSNALKFTHTGGVTLGITVVKQETPTLFVKFDVIDTGIGIKPQNLKTIFESFVQADADTNRKYGGTGLGLTISQKIAEVFGATLTVESEPGIGSHFCFAPVFAIGQDESKVVKEVLPEFKSLAGMNILVAEDNKINMLIARKFLLKWGAAITEAQNGKEAIECCRRSTFHLALLDLEMPEADGFTALAEIRTLHPALPAIAFTASVFENIGEALLQRGFNDYIAKPFTPHELNAKLHKQLQLSQVV